MIKEIYIVVDWSEDGYQILDTFLDKELAEKARDVYAEVKKYGEPPEVLTFEPSNALPTLYYQATYSIFTQKITISKELLPASEKWEEFLENNRSMYVHKYDAVLLNRNQIKSFIGYGLTEEEAKQDVIDLVNKYTNPDNPLNNIYTYYKVFLQYAPGKKYHGVFAAPEEIMVSDGSKFEDIIIKHEEEEIEDRADRDLKSLHGFWGIGLTKEKAQKHAKHMGEIILEKISLL